MITDKRLRMFDSTTGVSGRQKPVDLIFDASLEGLALQKRSGLLSGIDVTDRSTGGDLAQLNFGMRKRACNAVAEAGGAE